MKKKFIAGYQPEGPETPVEERVPPTGGSGTAPITDEVITTSKCPDEPLLEAKDHVVEVFTVNPSSVVTRGERLIIDTLIAGLEYQLQAGNAPSVYKNKLTKEITRIKNELRK